VGSQNRWIAGSLDRWIVEANSNRTYGTYKPYQENAIATPPIPRSHDSAICDPTMEVFCG
jgi:hypothetical protein